MDLGPDVIEDIKAAAMLHDIGKLDISRDLLYKAAKLTNEEYEEIKQHVRKGIGLLEPVGGSLRRVIPIVLAHHDKFDGTGYHPTKGEAIPIEARIIAVADVYDSLASDRPTARRCHPSRRATSSSRDPIRSSIRRWWRHSRKRSAWANSKSGQHRSRLHSCPSPLGVSDQGLGIGIP
jgi:response regulator RpfG family c-di-GMP phosphodiesterase